MDFMYLQLFKCNLKKILKKTEIKAMYSSRWGSNKKNKLTNYEQRIIKGNPETIWLGCLHVSPSHKKVYFHVCHVLKDRRRTLNIIVFLAFSKPIDVELYNMKLNIISFYHVLIDFSKNSTFNFISFFL